MLNSIQQNNHLYLHLQKITSILLKSDQGKNGMEFLDKPFFLIPAM